MLNTLTPTQVHGIAELAGAARDTRERMLHGIAAELVNAPHPAKGEADRAGAGLFDVLASDAPTTRALSAAMIACRDCIASPLARIHSTASSPVNARGSTPSSPARPAT